MKQNKENNVIVTVKSWDQYNSHESKKRRIWVRLDHNFFQHESVMILSCSAKTLYLYLICTCSRQDLAEVSINISLTSSLLRLKSSNVIKALGELEAFDMIEVSRPTDRQTDNTDSTIQTIQHEISSAAPSDSKKKSKIKKSKAKETPQEEQIIKTNFEIELPVKEKIGAQGLLDHFCFTYQNRFGASFQVTGKQAGCAKRLVSDKNLSLQNLKSYVDAYFQMNDSWFHTRGFDLITFEQNLQKIILFANSGKLITKKEAARMEDTAHSNKELSEYELLRLKMEKENEAELLLREEIENEKKQLIQ